MVTSVTDVGWTAEIAIPFRTLRYPRTEVQSWGMNFQRNIRIRNEQVYWSPLPRQFDLNRLSLAGELRSLRVPPQRNLQVTPYALGEALHRAEIGRNLSTGDVGADLKYSVTPSMTLDLTYNTDFAQVEVDDQQVNLDRFTLFFPEKRPFFLENAGLFSVGQPGGVDIFFSRRIGLSDDANRFRSSAAGACQGRLERTRISGFSACRRSQSTPLVRRCKTSPLGGSDRTWRIARTWAPSSSTGRHAVACGRPRLQPDLCVEGAGGSGKVVPSQALWQRPIHPARRRARHTPTRSALSAIPSVPFSASGTPRSHRTSIRRSIPGAPELPADKGTCLHDVPSRKFHGFA